MPNLIITPPTVAAGNPAPELELTSLTRDGSAVDRSSITDAILSAVGGNTVGGVIVSAADGDYEATWEAANGIGSPAVVTRTATVAAPVVPIPQISSLYFDAADAPIGDVTALQTRGSWAAVLSNAAFTGGAVAQMGAEGLRTRGNILRNISSQGPFRKITILADVVRDAITNGSRADIITINPNLAADFRLYLQFDPNRFMVTGPGGVILNLPTQWGFGARHVIGVELDLAAGRLTVMEPDGDTQSAVVPAVPLTIGRVEVGKAANSLIHQLALITEAAA